MEHEFQARVQEVLRHPRNQGEMAGADAVATVGNAACGEMLRLWVKFKEIDGRQVIDQATFEGYGCETAIALASLATERIRGKTIDQALAISGVEFAGELGPLPPLKIHCAQLVEAAVHDVLQPDSNPIPPAPRVEPSGADDGAGAHLLGRFLGSQSSGRARKIVRLAAGDAGGD
jgi:nitrogen fixation protein NifU and related proteins